MQRNGYPSHQVSSTIETLLALSNDEVAGLSHAAITVMASELFLEANADRLRRPDASVLSAAERH